MDSFTAIIELMEAERNISPEVTSFVYVPFASSPPLPEPHVEPPHINDGLSLQAPDRCWDHLTESSQQVAVNFNWGSSLRVFTWGRGSGPISPLHFLVKVFDLATGGDDNVRFMG